MAVITVNLTDRVSTFVDKVNQISAAQGDLGDIPSILPGDSTILDAITTLNDNRISVSNRVTALENDIRDSGEVVTITRSSISVNDVGGLGSLSFSKSTGVISYTGVSEAEVRALFSGTVGNISYSTSTGVFNFANPTTLQIKNSTGGVLKEITGAGA